MSEFSPAEQRIEAASALATVSQAGSGERYAAYVGLDVHKESIAVAVAVAVAEPGYRGTGKKGTGVFPPAGAKTPGAKTPVPFARGWA